MKRFWIVAALFLILTGITLFAWQIIQSKTSPASIAIPVRGGKTMHLRVAEALPHYCQSDPAWTGGRIGGSGESIGKVGCTLCCVGMAFDHFGLTGSDPTSLNTSLIEKGGYTDRGWIRWDAVSQVSDQMVGVTVHGSPSHRQIDEDLESGRLVIAKFYLPLGIPHWVLICGKDGDDYLIKDPARTEPGLIPLSQGADFLVAIRTLNLRS